MSKTKFLLGALALSFATVFAGCAAPPQQVAVQEIVEQGPFGSFTGTVSNADAPSYGYMTEEGGRSSPAGRFGAADFVVILYIEDGWIVDVDFAGSDTVCPWLQVEENPQRLGPYFFRARNFILENQSFENFPIAPRDTEVEPSFYTVDAGTGATYTRQAIREAGLRALANLP